MPHGAHETVISKDAADIMAMMTNEILVAAIFLDYHIPFKSSAPA